MKRKHFIGASLLLIVIGVALVRHINSPYWLLTHSDEFVLYSIEPDKADETAKEHFRNYPVLGKAAITDAAEKAALIDALFNSFIPDSANGCFQPHHAIHAVKGRQTIDMVICFECEYIQIYKNGDLSGCPLSPGAKELFNRTLRKYHLPVAKLR